MAEFIQSSPNIEKEIEVLERRLAEKKAQLSEKKEPFLEKEVAREVIRERVAEHLAAPAVLPAVKKSPAKTPSPLVPPAKISLSVLKKTPREKQLQILLGVAFKDSIPEAVVLAEKLDSPYLLDAMHDALVDKFYEELVRRGKI
jgi:hypothetical protein